MRLILATMFLIFGYTAFQARVAANGVSITDGLTTVITTLEGSR